MLTPIHPTQAFVYLTSALATGVVLERLAAPSAWAILGVFLLLFVAALRSMHARKDKIATCLLLLCLMLAGAVLSRAERTTIAPSRLKRLFETGVIKASEPVKLVGRLAMSPESAPDAAILDLETEEIRNGDVPVEATGRVRLTVRLAEQETRAQFESLELEYGSRISVLTRLERAKSYHNPGSPDYNEFLELKGYDLKGSVKSPLLVEVLGRVAVNRIVATLFQLRVRMLAAIDRSFAPPISGTLKAMLLGNRYFLDQAVEERLRQSGTFHVLVISGVHVGFIAMVLFVLTGGSSSAVLRVSRRAVIFRAVVSLAVLWAYAIMVGLAPPVTRAATMLTLGLIGPILFRRSASLNTVAFAAFVMVALQPSVLTDPSFQLSFVAVAAIAGLALPLIEALRQIAQWRPTPVSPHPPSCAQPVRIIAEVLFWDERRFTERLRESAIRYRPDKSPAAAWLSRWRLQWLLRSTATLLITSAAIQLCTLPLMACYFNRVTPVGVLLNVFSGLLSFVILIGALAAIAFAGFAAWLETLFVWIVNFGHSLLENSIAPFNKIPGATFRVAHYEGSWSIVYVLYFLPVTALAARIALWRPVDHFAAFRPAKRSQVVPGAATQSLLNQRRSPTAFRLLTVSVLVSAVVVASPPAKSSNGNLVVHFLDVGQGDAALIEFPRGTTMLVDAGGELRIGETSKKTATPAYGSESEPLAADAEAAFTDSAFHVGEAVVSRFLWSQGRTNLDYALATHSHADHMGGLQYVERNFSVGQALVGRTPTDEREFRIFRRASLVTSTRVGVVESGQQFDIEGVKVQVLWPPPPAVIPITSGNDDSVVLRLVYGSVAILLAGDIELAAERGLLESGWDLRADVLKVPHHGSRTSSTEQFLEAVRPRAAVISVGERSRFGHPHLSVIARYQKKAVRLFLTGRDGTVTVQTDGQSLDFSTYRE
jgi:competence protein ComEC